MNVQLPFKRKETTFTGGDVPRYAGDKTDYIGPQTVQIIKLSDPDEDTWKVRLVDGSVITADGCDLSPHPEAVETNVEFITRMMEWGQGGALLQAFILNAIEQQAKATLTATAEELDTGLISGAAWRSCAQEALGWFAARDASRT